MSSDSENYANWSDSEESDDENRTKNIKNYERSCKYCVKLVKSAEHLPEHEKKCSAALRNTADLVTCKDGSKRFLCDICFRFFKYLTGLDKHKKWHEPPGGFVCRYCDTRYCTSQELEKHKEESHQVYKCQICKCTHETLQKYLGHIKLEHNGLDRVWVHCDDCGFNFKSQSILNYHKRTKCGTIKPFKCDECGSHYQTQATLTIHKLIHTGEKAFCCSYCGKNFLSKGQLTVHERKHTGEKPYKCEVCSKAFSYRESLVTHSSLHTGIKPYVCEACDARFSCVGNLQKHRRTRPNSCGLPQYCVNKKAAPRPSSKIPGTLTMSNVKITKANKVIGLKGKNNSVDTIQNEPKNGNKFSKEANKKVEEENDIETILQSEDMKREVVRSGDEELREIDSTIQMLDIQVLNEPIEKEVANIVESTVMDYEEGVSCFVVTTAAEYHVIPFDQNKKSDVEEIIEHDEYEENEEILFDTKTVGYGDIKIDSRNYEENDADIVQQYNEDEMLLVIMKNEDDDDDDDEEENTPLSLLKASTEKSLNEATKDIVKTANELDPLNSCCENIFVDERCNAADSEPVYSEEENDNHQDSSITYVSKRDLYECEHCPKIYHHRRSFLKHLKGDHNLQQPELDAAPNRARRKKSGGHLCPHCKRSYINLKSLETHIKNHGPDGKLIYKSACCGQYFEKKEEADNHDKSAHSEMITCLRCGKTYADPDKLGAHKRYAHKENVQIPTETIDDKGKKKFSVCQKCGKKFTSKTALSDHERSDCGRSPLYKCDECDKHFHSAGSLKTHKTVHTGELPHLCNFCGKAFRTFGQVKVHQRKHNGEKPFKCNICPKAFAYRESLLTHISVHTGVKRFMCEGCGRRFSCISNLLMHRKFNKGICGAIPSNTKRISEAIGVSHGVLYVGERPE